MASYFDYMKKDTNDFDLGGDTYKPTQSNVLGQDLAPVNNQGELSATDPAHDTRSPQQIKSDAQLANQVASASADEDDNSFVSASGNKYEKVDGSAANEALTAAFAFGASYFTNGMDGGAAAVAAGKATDDLYNKAHRFGQIDRLEAQGFNPIDIQNFINSGDKKDLVTNKGGWSAAGNGMIVNNLTGETKQIAPNVTRLSDNTAIVTDEKGSHIYQAGTQYGQQVAGAQDTTTGTVGGTANTNPSAPATGGADGLITNAANGSAPQRMAPAMDKNNQPIVAEGQLGPNGETLYLGRQQGTYVNANNEVVPKTYSQDQLTQQRKQVENQKVINKQIDNIDSMVGTVQKLVNSKGFDNAYGVINSQFRTFNQDTKDAESLRNQLGGQIFNEVRQYLKGQGPITDYESQRAEAAMTILTDPSISTKAAYEAANELIDALKSAKQKLQARDAAQAQQQQQNQAPAKSGDYSHLW